VGKSGSKLTFGHDELIKGVSSKSSSCNSSQIIS
jgi:hypothetical protein